MEHAWMFFCRFGMYLEKQVMATNLDVMLGVFVVVCILCEIFHNQRADDLHWVLHLYAGVKWLAHF